MLHIIFKNFVGATYNILPTHTHTIYVQQLTAQITTMIIQIQLQYSSWNYDNILRNQ